MSVSAFVCARAATGNTIIGAPRTLPGSGLATVYAGKAAADFYGVPVGEDRRPDLVGVVQHGVVYTGGTKKIAEHSGMDPQDRDVPIVVSAAGRHDDGLDNPETPPDGGGHDRRAVNAPVETTQIAPTILRLLGLDPQALQAVRIEKTPVLPGSTNQ